jgi:phosphatidylserine/phosphatidylglycerophosphate/cardiolipin synthase-like enzyme
VGRHQALETCRRAGPERVHVFDLENHAGTPVYVHAKVCIVDDTWAAVGSANLNMRSWTHDSELTAAVLDASGDGTGYARGLRLQLMAEHLDRTADDVADLVDPISAAETTHKAALALDDWWEADRAGERPPGRLRWHHLPKVQGGAQVWGPVMNNLINDPDGRPFGWRRSGRW